MPMSTAQSGNETPGAELTLEAVEKALDMIRPGLQGDGGDVQVVDIKDGSVTLNLIGSCQGCPSSTATLKYGLENFLKAQFPGVKEVLSA